MENQTTAGVDFLRNSQAEDGSWTAPNRPGVSGLITTSLLMSGLPVDDPTVAKALKHLESFVQEDGGIYNPEGNHRNYETCISLVAFEKANGDGRYDTHIKNAEKFLRGLQWDEGEGLESNDTSYGGAGYGSHQRPDMSNTQFFLDALKAAGAKEDDPAVQKALIFVSRAQNLESEFNQTAFAGKINDGGFFYTPAAGGETKAGETENGGLRSYGSMTYAGLKSMVYAGLDKDDKRVAAALDWIKKHYTLDTNPGMGEQGLFYYYHTFGKTLDVLGQETIESADGKQHNWRAELVSKLGSLQRSNGSWVNKADRWYEGDPNLVTAYALMALSHCEK
ncbi:MAG: terpene cyclase/mutase family protein [Planctomycetaceae bacterium]|nr:terpene cyclase/mutase family protein [Planctomycetaceae bacterium]